MVETPVTAQPVVPANATQPTTSETVSAEEGLSYVVGGGSGHPSVTERVEAFKGGEFPSIHNSDSMAALIQGTSLFNTKPMGHEFHTGVSAFLLGNLDEKNKALLSHHMNTGTLTTVSGDVMKLMLDAVEANKTVQTKAPDGQKILEHAIAAAQVGLHYEAIAVVLSRFPEASIQTAARANRGNGNSTPNDMLEDLYRIERNIVASREASKLMQQAVPVTPATAPHAATTVTATENTTQTPTANVAPAAPPAVATPAETSTADLTALAAATANEAPAALRGIAPRTSPAAIAAGGPPGIPPVTGMVPGGR